MMKNLYKDYKVNGFKLDKLFILFIYRLGNKIYYSNINKFIKNVLLFFINIIRKIFIVFMFKIEMPFKCKIGEGLRLMHPQGIILHENCEIGMHCTIFHQVTVGSNEHSINPNSVAVIKNNIYIGAGAKIIGDIIIEEGAKIGANAVVVKNIPKNATVYSKQIIKI